MQIALGLLFATLVSCVQAADAGLRVAPDSIAGKAYHDYNYFLGYATWRTIAFDDDQRFSYIWQFHNRDRSGFLGVHLTAPDPDGTYTFTRVDNTHGTLQLVYSDGSQERINLTFLTPTGGHDPNPAAEHNFYLTDLSIWRASAGNNSSTRATALPGQPLVVGFVVPQRKEPQWGPYQKEGDYAQPVLIRVVGPSLRQFGIANGWADPKFKLYRNGVQYQAGRNYDDWSEPVQSTTGGIGKQGDPRSGFNKLFSYVGAFPLAVGSKDAAAFFQLNGGAYTIACDPSDAGGEVLVEIYFLP